MADEVEMFERANALGLVPEHIVENVRALFPSIFPAQALPEIGMVSWMATIWVQVQFYRQFAEGLEALLPLPLELQRKVAAQVAAQGALVLHELGAMLREAKLDMERGPALVEDAALLFRGHEPRGGP